MDHYILNSNSFTMDTRSVRLTRLFYISSKIEEFAAELCLEQDTMDWALEAHSNFHTALINQTIESGKKAELSKISLDADFLLYERYIILKDLIISRNLKNKALLLKYGVNAPSPTIRKERYYKAKQLAEAHEYFANEKNTGILPQLMIDNFNTLLEDSFAKNIVANSKKTNSLEKTNFLNELFNEDSIKIRNLYNWIAAFWGKRDIRLFSLGFIPMNSGKNIGANLRSITIEFDKKSKKIYWNSLENIEYYQLARKDKETISEWIEIASTSETFVVSNLAQGEYLLKLRVWTANGFSDWSNEFVLNLTL
jgi:hypothetical protein